MHRRRQALSWNLLAHTDSDLIEALPELDTLRQVVEGNDWHTDDPLQQALRLFHWVKRLPASLPETISVPEIALHALLDFAIDSEHGHYTAQELLAFAALIHDVGKAATFQHLPDGTTRCSGHEAVGARMAPAICARFDFTPAETRFIVDLVGAHGVPYALFKETASLSIPWQQERIGRSEAEHAHHLPLLLLLAWGDLVTSHLQTFRPEKYDAVLDFYRRWLQRVWRKGEQESTKAGRPNEVEL